MSTFFKLVCATLLAAAPLTAQDIDEEHFQHVNIEQLSTMLGHLMGSNLKGPGFTLDVEAIVRGIRAGAAGKPAPMSLEDYQGQLEHLQQIAFDAQANKNLQDAENYLAANRGLEGIVELEPGKLQYRILQEGKGQAVQVSGTPLIHYTGRYADGSVFGTSTEGEPLSMTLDQTLPGFARGIVGMKEGEKRIVYIHPDLGYGTSGALAPNAALVFEVEVVKAETRDTKAS